MRKILALLFGLLIGPAAAQSVAFPGPGFSSFVCPGPFGGNSTSTTSLLHFDGANASTTFTDSNAGGSAHTWTANGSAQLNTSTPKFGSAAGTFNGTTDYIQTPNHADFVATTAYTIEMWIYPTAVAAFDTTIMNSSNAGSFGPWLLQIDSNNKFRFFASSNGTSWDINAGTEATTLPVQNTWQHIAIVWSGTNYFFFINGVQDWTVANSVTPFATVSPIQLGALSAFGQFYNGKIDEFRFSKNIARWTSNFTPPTYAYCP